MANTLAPNQVFPRRQYGTLTVLNDTVYVLLMPAGAIGVQITGTWVGTITFQGTRDDETWFSVLGSATGTAGAQASTTTANGQWDIDGSSLSQFRCKMTAFTSGTANVTILYSEAPSGQLNIVGTDVALSMSGALAAGSEIIGKVGIDQTTPGTTNAVAPISGQTGVAGGSGVVGATTQRVVLATDVALPAGTAILGKVGIDQTTPGTTNLVAVTGIPAAAALADAAANPTTPMLGSNLLVWNGATWDRKRVANVRKDLSAVTITTITTVWTPAGGKKIRLMGGSISVSAACSVLFEDNAAAATVYRTPKLLADTPYNFDLGSLGPILATADNVLKATSSAAATVTGTLWGVEE